MSFKVGDWVIRGSVTATNKLIFKIKAFGILDDEELALFNGHSAPLNELTLWQPKVGEWCWFWDDGDTEAVLGQLTDMEDRKRKVYYFTKSYITYQNIEPFIGELPSFIKDNK